MSKFHLIAVSQTGKREVISTHKRADLAEAYGRRYAKHDAHCRKVYTDRGMAEKLAELADHYEVEAME